MASLRYSAASESEDTLNSFTSHTGYEPNLLTFGELNDSSVPFSFMIPSSDQDMDDLTLTQKKSVESYKDNYGDRNWNFLKLINKVLQKWRNYGNSRVLPSILWRDESSSKIRTLFWNYQAVCRNCRMK